MVGEIGENVMLDLLIIIQAIHTCFNSENLLQRLDFKCCSFQIIVLMREVEITKMAFRAPDSRAIGNDSYISADGTTPVFVCFSHPSATDLL